MTTIQAIILGSVQGITEFLPISSSGHLVLIPYFFGWDIQSVVFDIAVHFGTACAVLIYFYRDWLNMVLATQNDAKDYLTGKTLTWNSLRPSSRLLLTIIVVTIPVGLLGMIFEEAAEDYFRSAQKVAVMLILISLYMWYAEFVSMKNQFGRKLNFVDSMIVSLSQLVALIPGSSRSGMTISTGLIRGYERTEVAKFSFLLATPLIVAATLLHLGDILSLNSGELANFILGLVTSFAFGYASIAFLIKYLQNNSLKIFIWYRILVGVLVLIYPIIVPLF